MIRKWGMGRGWFGAEGHRKFGDKLDGDNIWWRRIKWGWWLGAEVIRVAADMLTPDSQRKEDGAVCRWSGSFRNVDMVEGLWVWCGRGCGDDCDPGAHWCLEIWLDRGKSVKSIAWDNSCWGVQNTGRRLWSHRLVLSRAEWSPIQESPWS